MNKNTVIGISLIVILYIGWGWYMSQNAPPPIPQPIVEQIENTDNAELLPIIDTAKTVAAVLNDGDSVAVRNLELKEIYGNFASSALEINKKETYTIENDKFTLTISNVGGKVDNVVLKHCYTYDSLPLVLFNSEQSNFEFGFFSANRALLTSSLVFEPVFYDIQPTDGVIKVVDKDSVRFGLRLYADGADGNKSKESYMEYLYTVKGNENMVDFDVIFNNTNTVMDQNSLTMYWNSELNRQEKSLKDERTNSTIFYKYVNEDGVEDLGHDKDVKEKLSTDVKWISYKDKFFVSTLIADEGFTSATVEMYNDKKISNPNYLLSMSTESRPMFSDANVIGMKWYFGGTYFKELSKYGDLDLERQVPIGWGFFLLAWINKYIIINVFDWLSTFGWNYGIIILLLTIGLKIVLSPLTYKTYLSGARMRLLKPDIEELNKKYPKKDDAMKKQQATMALYKKAGASPMSGCLPMLLQFPILIAMFRFFPSAIELRQQHFLWATDLSTYDSIWNFGFDIPFYGDHVSLFCLLMTISMLISTWMNSSSQPTNNNMPGMKFMMYAMPILFMGIFNNYSAALSYYYLLTNLFTIGQMLIMRAVVDDNKLRHQIELNKKKPIKKSAWMQRLEDMQKQQSQPTKPQKRK